VKRALLAKHLLPLATFERRRPELQAEAQAHREDRAVQIGGSATLIFENEVTVRFRLQEILRQEAMSDDAAVQAQIDAYAALIPDGANLKATLRLDFASAGERTLNLPQLRGIENYVWMQIERLPRVYAIAERDIDHADTQRDEALQYVRFELDETGVQGLRQGRAVSFGVDHPAYSAHQAVGENVRQALLTDLHQGESVRP